MKIKKFIEEQKEYTKKSILNDLRSLRQDIKNENCFAAVSDARWIIWDFAMLYALELLEEEIENEVRKCK